MFKWFMGFNGETFDDAREEEIQAMVNRYQNDDVTRSLYFWEVEGEPVSMTAATRPTMNGICVTAVYTPPDKRKRGYASACVAAVTQKCLDMGFQFCTLYTDLSNPTSNHIYQEIGYKPIVDINMIEFLNPTA
jgi:predicted GNAT family acetyltransferase